MEQPNLTEAAECEKHLRSRFPDLRLVWNPQAFLATPGSYDVYGNAMPPRYEGRYQVVVKGILDGEDTVVHTLGTETDPKKPYRAPGPWLIEFMAEWDAANLCFAESMRKMYDQAEAEARTAQTRKDEEAEEETHRFAAEHGARNHWAVGIQLKH